MVPEGTPVTMVPQAKPVTSWPRPWTWWLGLGFAIAGTESLAAAIATLVVEKTATAPLTLLGTSGLFFFAAEVTDVQSRKRKRAPSAMGPTRRPGPSISPNGAGLRF
jgi:hypothetical protein